MRSSGTLGAGDAKAADARATGPLVTIVVSCYNIERYVTACLESIAAQTYPTLEVILVDDGATDDTGEILRRFATGRAGWCVHSKPNGGPSSARNAGIELASGEWLMFVDGDDVLDPQAVEKLLAVALSLGVPLVCGNHWVQSGGRDVAVGSVGTEARVLTQREAFESVLYHGELDVSAWGKIYARTLFEAVRYPDGRIYEDTYVFDDILAQVDRVAYLPMPLYHYVMRSGSIVNVAWSGKQLQFIDAADKFAARAEERFPDLAAGSRRRRVHARLSVLRYMERVEGADRDLRRETVTFIRDTGRSVLADRAAPARDKVGIVLVMIAPTLFFLFWRLYSLCRRDR